MYQKRFKVKIKYKDIDGVDYKASYSLFAESKEDAINIVRELFFMDFGTFEDMHIEAEYELPSKAELEHVNRALIEQFGIIKQKFSELSYKQFLQSFQIFDGYNMIINIDSASFYFRFQNIECKAIYQNGSTYIDETEVYYHGVDRLYVITDRLCTVLIGNGK